MSNLGPAWWLLFVEDPGAINYFVPLVEDLENGGLPYRICAEGHAVTLLEKKGIIPFQGFPKSIIDGSGNPSLIVVGTSENPDTLAFDYIVWGRQRGIPSAAIIDSGINADYRFKGRSATPLTYAPDFLLVPDDWSAEAFKKLGFDPKKIFVVGHPMQDRMCIKEPRDVVRGKVLPRETLERFVLVFISEISTGLNPKQYQKSESYTLYGRGTGKLRTEIVVEELLDAIKRLEAEGVKRPYMILRRHPKETDRDLEKLSQEFDAVSITDDPLELVYAADLVVGMSSILLNEAHLLGTQTLAVLPRDEEKAWLPGVRTGEIPCETDRSSLIKRLRQLMIYENVKRHVNHALLSDNKSKDRYLVKCLMTISESMINLETDDLLIVPFESHHFTASYIAWLNDPDVVRYSEQRHIHHTRITCQRYVESFSNSINRLLAIEKKEGLVHIGNISITYDIPNGIADVAILIGEKHTWGRGYGSQAWIIVLDKLLSDGCIRKVTAGTMAENKAMLKLMKRGGMQIEAVRPRHFLFDRKEVDLVYAARYSKQ